MKKSIKSVSITTPGFQLGTAMTLFVITAWMAHDGQMAVWEKQIFNTVYGLPSDWSPVFLAITQLGGIGVLIALALVLLLKRYYPMVTLLLTSGFIASFAANIAKSLVGRPRPQELLSDIIYRDALAQDPGFPSGHTAVAAAIGLTLWHYLPRKYRWITPALIVSVGLSRIYLGVHAPLDVIGGFAIGWASVALFHCLRQRRQSKKA